MVFCGNDSTSTNATPFDNEHAEIISQTLRTLDPSLKCIIATSKSEEDGNELIRRFVDDGHGDILIVKQMASLGLDAPRLKTCLDLSATRTMASFIQRITRIATPFDIGQSRIEHCEYITPDDVLGLALFQRMITDEGGWAQVTAAEIVIEKLVPKGDPPPPESMEVNEAIDAPFQDQANRTAEADKLPVVRVFQEALPAAIAHYSDPELSRIIKDYNITVGKPPPPSESSKPKLTGLSDAEANSDLNAHLARLRTECTRAQRSIATRIVGNPKHPDYSRLCAEVMNEHKDRCGIPRKTNINHILIPEILERLRDSLQKEQGEV